VNKLFGAPKPNFNISPQNPPDNYKEDIDYLRSLLKDDNLIAEVKEEFNANIKSILRGKFKHAFLVKAI
jgi:hypothetical protein